MQFDNTLLDFRYISHSMPFQVIFTLSGGPTMDNTEIYFLEKIREFKKIEQEFIKFTYEVKTPGNKEESEHFMNKAIELAFDAVEKRNMILGEMHDVSDIQIYDQKAKIIIEKLRQGERFESLVFAENLASLFNKEIDNFNEQIKTELKDYFYEDKIEELWEEFHSWFYIPDYYYRKAQIGSIITSSKLPLNIVQYFEEIKEAYAFGLDKSCISLSRALLEISLHYKLKRKGFFKSSKITNIDIAKEDPLHRYIFVAQREGLISKEAKELALEIKNKGNRVLHIKDTQDFSVRGQALKTIKDTVSVIEYLYR